MLIKSDACAVDDQSKILSLPPKSTTLFLPSTIQARKYPSAHSTLYAVHIVAALEGWNGQPPRCSEDANSSAGWEGDTREAREEGDSAYINARAGATVKRREPW